MFAFAPNSRGFRLLWIPANQLGTIFQLNRNRKDHY